MNLMNFFNELTGIEAINILIAIGIVVGLDILSPLFSYAIIKIFNIKERKIKRNAFYVPLKTFFKLFGLYMALVFLRPTFNFSDQTMNIITKTFKVIVILTTSTGLANSITRNSMIIRRMRESSEREFDDITINFTIRAIKMLIYIVATFMIIADLGYDLSGLITGLGLGSVVVTLAAQDTIKNLFGGLMIFLDKPFKVGDYIQFGSNEGTVEDITFRSTRIRTLDNSIAQVPNAEISNAIVTNLSRINTRRYKVNLPIVLNTNLNKMMKLEKDILESLNSLDIVVEDSVVISFSEIRSNDYKIYVHCYIKVSEYRDFLAEKEKINYQIMGILEKNDIELAYETKTIEIKNYK